ncbi:hypothetical protein NEOC84_000082|nr:hypothetical protein [Neochlamydia sp. AcF84]
MTTQGNKMHPISSGSIESLPNELLLPILEACVAPPLFSVCKRWHHLLATEVMPSLYKQIGKMHFPQGDVNERALLIDKIYKLDEGLPEIAKVAAIFKQVFSLAIALSPLELEFKWRTEEKKYLTLANYSSYMVNTNRLLMWKKLPGGEEFLEQEEIKYLPLERKGELFGGWIEEHGKEITCLNLTEKGLTFLPLEIVLLPQLQALYLSNNHLTILPREIIQLSHLKCLNLNDNQLNTLPAELGQLSNLRRLLLEGNQLNTLPVEIGRLSQLRELSLEVNQLISLPAEIGQLAQLKKLNLNYNQLSTLPAEIGQMSKLQKLFLEGNYLITLPAEIGQLSQLQTLSLESNQLAFLPVEMGQLAKLKDLDLKDNQLTHLPKEMGQLTYLESLVVRCNLLTSLPKEICQLLQLRRLDIRYNQLTFLPVEIEQLNNNGNVILDLIGNPFESIPHVLKERFHPWY